MKAVPMTLLLYFTLFFLRCSEGVQDLPAPPVTPEPPQSDTFNYLFRDNMAGYEVFRIPAIVKTKKGTLLAFAEARRKRANRDSGDIDLVVRKSEDGGKSWGDLITIWEDGLNTCANPVPIVDEQTGKIHLLMTWNHGEDYWGDIVSGESKDTKRPFYAYSQDDGVTWSTPVEITSAVKQSDWDWYGTGPLHGIQIQKGPYAGRLVAPNYYTVQTADGYLSYSHVIYSDDGGTTWKPGKAVPMGGVGECAVTEVADGQLMLNMRPNNSMFRQVSTSMDGGMTWSEPETDHELIDPKCQASLLSFGQDNDTLLFANAASAERANLTLKMSTDGGKSWSRSYVVHEGPSAYSDIVMITKDSVGILYEGGMARPYEGIAFETIHMNDIN